MVGARVRRARQRLISTKVPPRARPVSSGLGRGRENHLLRAFEEEPRKWKSAKRARRDGSVGLSAAGTTVRREASPRREQGTRVPDLAARPGLAYRSTLRLALPNLGHPGAPSAPTCAFDMRPCGKEDQPAMSQLKKKPLFNPLGDTDVLDRRMIGRNTTNLNDFNNMDEWASDWYRRAMNNFPGGDQPWRGHQGLPQTARAEHRAYDKILSFLIFRPCGQRTCPNVGGVHHRQRGEPVPGHQTFRKP